jgi:3-oxoacyl-[acyl-carrier-protein] synthase II
MLLLAAHEAWAQSGWEPSDDLPMVLGTTAAGMALGEVYFRVATQTPHRHRYQPTRALHYQAQTQGRTIANAFGFSGPITIISNACASGSNAIGHAWELIRSGRHQRVLAGGYDALSQLVFAGFDALQTLSPTLCRPFDAGRDGLAIGEGAAMLTLETLDHARHRGADILGEVIGYGATIDQHHLTQPHPQGDAALAAMTLACQSARVTAADIDYLNAHGTGTPLNDSAEALAIRRWAGPRTATLPVSSTKASIGHLLGGAGAVEAVVCLMALREQWLPPETALETPDPACGFPIVRTPQDSKVNTVLSNSFGFGGVNASLILRRWT